MVLKNALRSGYPFAESIAACLPVSDEVLISEGYSTDGTFEIVQKIAKLNKKIKIYRQQWPIEKKYSVIGEVTNSIRTKCSYDYIFSIQANEIVHEESATLIKELPEICPNVNTFSLPFIHFVKNFKFYEDFRLRFSKNLNDIVAVGDGWTLGLSKTFTTKEAFKTLKKPQKLVRYMNKGIEWTYANTCGNLTSRAFYLPKPVFRYWSLFPQDYLEKCEQHAQMFGLDELKEDAMILRRHLDNPPLFWKEAARIRRDELDFHYPDPLGMVEKKDHPKIMRDLLSDSDMMHYHVREEVLESIRAL